MNNRSYIADLCGQDIITFHDLEHCAEGALSTIPGIHYLPDGTSNNVVDNKHVKPFNRGHNAAAKVTDLFNRYAKNVTVSTQAMNSGLVTGPPPEARLSGGIHDSIDWFEKIQFQHKDTSLTSTHYLHFSSPSPLLQDAADITSINITTGICLFAGRALASSIPSNEHGFNMSALEHTEPTIYELDMIARVAPAIADLVALLKADHGHENCRESGFNGPLNVSLDIPSFHYYHTVEKRLKDQLCTFPEAIRWMDAVEKRHYQISRVFRRYIQHELARRGRHETHIQVSSSGTAGFVYHIIQKSLREGVLVSLGHVLQRISAYDPVWNRFFELITEKEKPHDFLCLGYLFYVYDIARPALLHDGILDSPRPNPLLISIDDTIERRIYRRTQQLFKKVRAIPEYPVTPKLLEIYPCRRIFMDNNQTNMGLYCHDPSPERLDAHSCKCRRALATIVNKNGCRGQDCHFMTQTGDKRRIDAFGVVGMLFGADAGAVLRKICVEEGLIS